MKLDPWFDGPYCFGNFLNLKYLSSCYECDYALACSRMWESNRPKHGKLWRLARALYIISPLRIFFPIAC